MYGKAKIFSHRLLDNNVDIEHVGEPCSKKMCLKERVGVQHSWCPWPTDPSPVSRVILLDGQDDPFFSDTCM